MIKLSILIPSTHQRYNNFNIAIQEQLFSQYNKLTAESQKQVEILMLVDTKSMMLGSKRNNLVQLSQGEYIVFVDSDDRIEPDYIETLLKATEYGVDVITFNASVSINGDEPKICRYSSNYAKDYNTDTEYHRLPNHICCFKRNLAIQYPFPNKLYGEDSEFSKSIKPHIKTDHYIDRVLYHYDYNQETTETQYHLGSNTNSVIDIVILSNAINHRYKALTQQAIDTAFATCGNNPINVIVIEQASGIVYRKCKTIHITDTKFNYNKFANIGASHGSAKYIMISNNDVIFNKGWLDALLANGSPLMGTRCPYDIRQKDLTKDETGDIVGRNLSGWCFAIKRELWETIHGFDEDFDFFFADNSLVEQCRSVGILPVVVYNSVIRHLGSQTLRAMPNKDELMFSKTKLFNDKYGKNVFEDNPSYINYLKKHG